LKFKYYILILFATLIAITGYWVLRPMNPRKGGKVEIRKEHGKFFIYKDGAPFFVKGGSGFTHMKELAAAGGNTIRTWDTTNLGKILDEAEANHLVVIAGFYIPESSFIKEFYSDSSKTGSMMRAYLEVVNRYKGHSALLAWCVGNELSFDLSVGKAPFYKAMKRLLRNIREADINHPVTTTIIERSNLVGIKLFLPYFDFISINTFANIKRLGNQLSNISFFWDGPYLITEWNPKGGWETATTAWQSPIENTSTKTAEQVSEYYEDYMPVSDKRFLGSLIFYWGNKEEYTHTWFSIFNEDGKPTEVLEAIRDRWQGKKSLHTSPQIEYILLDDKGAADNILAKPFSEHQAVPVTKKETDTSGFQYHWQILKEDWWSYFKKDPQTPAPERGLIADRSKRSIEFLAPAEEGPYRLFLTVSNNKGYIATANIPFYVVSNP
jgi:hypothetical protein